MAAVTLLSSIIRKMGPGALIEKNKPVTMIVTAKATVRRAMKEAEVVAKVGVAHHTLEPQQVGQLF